jgi:hypothetical protein
VRVYKDHGISGAKGKDKRPQFVDRRRWQGAKLAPQYGRARVLANAIEIATRQIQEPIGRISPAAP